MRSVRGEMKLLIAQHTFCLLLLSAMCSAAPRGPDSVQFTRGMPRLLLENQVLGVTYVDMPMVLLLMLAMLDYTCWPIVIDKINWMHKKYYLS